MVDTITDSITQKSHPQIIINFFFMIYQLIFCERISKLRATAEMENINAYQVNRFEIKYYFEIEDSSNYFRPFLTDLG